MKQAAGRQRETGRGSDRKAGHKQRQEGAWQLGAGGKQQVAGGKEQAAGGSSANGSSRSSSSSSCSSRSESDSTATARQQQGGGVGRACCITEADNTVRESKNQWMMKYHCLHLLDGRARIVLQLHMSVGHTHDRLGVKLSSLILAEDFFSVETKLGFPWIVSATKPKDAFTKVGAVVLLLPLLLRLLSLPPLLPLLRLLLSPACCCHCHCLC
jgi:hypothetical protein